MLLPVVFMCNALLLLTVLNSRFRLLAEAIVSGGVFVLSIVLNLLLSPAFNDATGQFGNGMNVLLLLVAAVFLYTNNLAQKLSLSLLMICNYAFLLPVTTTLLKALPFAGDGIWSQLTVHCADIPLFYDAGTSVSLFCTARRFGAVCGALCGACCLFILRKWNFADFFRAEQRNAAPYSDSGTVPCFGVYGACGI